MFRDENENFVLLVLCFEAWYSYINQRNVRHTTIFSWASYYRVAHSRSAESRIAYWWVAHSRPGIHNSVQREAYSTFEMGFRISVFQSRVSRQEQEFLFFSLMLRGLVFTYQTKNVQHITIFSWVSCYRVAHSRSAESGGSTLLGSTQQAWYS